MRPSALALKVAYGALELKGEDYLLIQETAELPAAGPYVRTSLDSAQEAEADVRPRAAPEPQPQASSSGRSLEDVSSYGLFCVFDGHNGNAAASHSKKAFAQAVLDRLPDGSMPHRGSKQWQHWCQGLQKALVGALADVHESFACCGAPAGCTATAVLQTGSMLTVANLGDSRACLDTGRAVAQLTVDHRVATHKAERKRLQAQKVHIAPIGLDGDGPAKGPESDGFGPLRMWPGGLCLSRAIGDYDVGTNVLCAPHIQQVILPESGGRLIVGSDGVWDAFDSNARLSKLVRGLAPHQAQDRVLRTIQNMHGGIRDDATLIVVDLMPPDTTFPQLCAGSGMQRLLSTKGSGGGSGSGSGSARSGGSSGSGSGKSRGACFCLTGPATVEESEPSSARPVVMQQRRPGELEVLTNVDIAACAGLMQEGCAHTPAWLDASWAADIRQIQEAAVEAWEVASAQKGKGHAPSRVDLAGYFARAHSVPLPKPRQKQHPADYTVKFGAQPPQAEAFEEAEPDQAELDRQSASQHFKDAVATEGSYGNKFGHYHGDTISSTPDPTQPGTQAKAALAGQAQGTQDAQPATDAPSKPDKDGKKKDKGRRVHIVEVQR